MKHHWRTNKILPPDKTRDKASALKDAGKKLVTLNGVFDILHAGHLDMLEEAKQQGDVLFVGMNSDASVIDGKGEKRPFIPEKERAAMLAALVCVDYVIIIDAPYNEVQNELLRTIKPHVHVNGSEYGPPETWLEWPIMQEHDVKPYIVQRREGLATSDIIDRIRKT